MKIKFLGAAGTVTGSSYVLTSESGASIMIDLGMFQGTQDINKLNLLSLDYDCSQLVGIVLTHAHLDHCGRLPLATINGFDGKIYMTEPTKDLTEVVLRDTAKIAKNSKGPEIYNQKHVDQTVKKFTSVNYEQKFTIGPFSINMRDAGHILGSASLEIVDTTATVGSKKIIFSGDLGNSPELLVKETQPFESADVVVMESTYGGKLHPLESHFDVIQKEINLIEQSGGTLLIPAFSLERTQELLYTIKHLKLQKKINNETPVVLDSPMAQIATDIYRAYPTFFNLSIQAEFKTGDPFEFNNLSITQSARDNEFVSLIPGPKVIIAGSGMMTGGRILDHALRYLTNQNNRILIVGYQGEETLGREIEEGKNPVFISGERVNIKAAVNATQSMSSHADQNQLLSWLKHIQAVKNVILIHGEDAPRNELKQKIVNNLAIKSVEMPHLNDEIVA